MRVHGVTVAAVLHCLWFQAACGLPSGTSYRSMIQSERPHVRIRAIHQAGELRDEKAVALLVDRLEDEDEGVRFYAILALDRITGERFGYDYAARSDRRAEAVDRWREYARTRLAAGGMSAVGGVER